MTRIQRDYALNDPGYIFVCVYIEYKLCALNNLCEFVIVAIRSRPSFRLSFLLCLSVACIFVGIVNPDVTIAMDKDGETVSKQAAGHKQEAADALKELREFAVPLSTADAVMVMQAWNKVLAFKTAFSEALLLQWRILVATQNNSGSAAAGIREVEKNNDPVGMALKERLFDAEELLVGLLDGAIRSLCPKHQKVARESYRAVADDVELLKVREHEDSISLECLYLDDYLKLFARVGITPDMWVIFCEAFVWTMKTHVPYAQEDDADDLAGGNKSAIARMVAQHVAVPAIKQIEELKSWADDPVYKTVLPALWGTLSKTDKADFGEAFYRTLLTKHPQLIDNFAKTDMDSLSLHLMMALDLVVASVSSLGTVDTPFRTVLNHLGELHRRMGVPTYSYALVGGNLIDNLQPVFHAAEKAVPSIKAPTYTKAFTDLYVEVMSIVYYPMLRQEKLIVQAKEFYRTLQPEFQWSDVTLEDRMLEIEMEIAATGKYTQTSEELQMGARLAWRNSAKCIGK
jgi:hemoglobin-like flavoprotein